MDTTAQLVTALEEIRHKAAPAGYEGGDSGIHAIADKALSQFYRDVKQIPGTVDIGGVVTDAHKQSLNPHPIYNPELKVGRLVRDKATGKLWRVASVSTATTDGIQRLHAINLYPFGVHPAKRGTNMWAIKVQQQGDLEPLTFQVRCVGVNGDKEETYESTFEDERRAVMRFSHLLTTHSKVEITLRAGWLEGDPALNPQKMVWPILLGRWASFDQSATASDATPFEQNRTLREDLKSETVLKAAGDAGWDSTKENLLPFLTRVLGCYASLAYMAKQRGNPLSFPLDSYYAQTLKWLDSHDHDLESIKKLAAYWGWDKNGAEGIFPFIARLIKELRERPEDDRIYALERMASKYGWKAGVTLLYDFLQGSLAEREVNERRAREWEKMRADSGKTNEILQRLQRLDQLVTEARKVLNGNDG